MLFTRALETHYFFHWILYIVIQTVFVICTLHCLSTYIPNPALLVCCDVFLSTPSIIIITTQSLHYGYVDYHEIANTSGTHFTVASWSQPASYDKTYTVFLFYGDSDDFSFTFLGELSI